jgi:alginate O-acetyltransferase complex protein AlgI
MIFSSGIFLFYFLPVFYIIYLVLPIRFRNIFLLTASLFFYAWGAPKFIFIVTSVIIGDFYIVKEIYKSSKHNKRKLLLATSIFVKITLLIYFKYANFFIENINFVLLHLGISTIKWTKIALPIGISFFTFQAITYSVDIYRNVHKPLKKVSDYLLYILMFPQLIAGPIVRFNEIADRIEDRKQYENNYERILGFYRFVIGLSKKVLIADVLAIQADYAFSLTAEELTSSIAITGILAYTFQIYFDFSGYSDMAIGLGRMLGFKFPENFDNPYISSSITEFWRRWHITLGKFMRDYLYIPLGGNRKGVKQMYFNLAFVFIVSGFWHGAAWNFIIWGAYHGFFLILDRLFLLKFLNKTGKYFSVIITFILTIIGWVIFRANTVEQIQFFIYKLFSFNFEPIFLQKEFIFTMFLAVLFSFITITNIGQKLQDFFFFKENYKTQELIFLLLIIFTLFLISSAKIIAGDFSPFIYFRF